MAPRVMSPVTGSRLNVKGRKIAMPVSADIPGRAPSNAPTREPIVSHKRFVKLNA